MLELILALNFKTPDCPNYWVRPDTGRVECLQMDNGQMVRVGVPNGGDLFLSEEGSDYYLVRSRFERSGAIVYFPLVQKLYQPVRGVSTIDYWFKVNCRTDQYVPLGVDIGNGIVKNTTNWMRSPKNADYQKLINEVCR